MTTKAGMSTERLARWDQHVQDVYLGTGILPGALTTVYRRGEVVHHSVQGMADVERNIPLREDHIFRIYSMTKPIASVAFMMLVEEGRVSLNDPVSAFIPEWAGLDVLTGGKLGSFTTEAPRRPMRMIDLLRHTAGLSYFIQQGSPIDDAYRQLGIGTRTTLDEFITALAGVPLQFHPGEVWHYSAATDVVGYLVGRISGMPFEQFLKTRILEPLGMHDTDFYVPAGKAERLTAMYALTEKGRVLADDPQKSPFLAPPHFVSGGGGLVSTAADYLRWCRFLLRGGELDGVRLISPRTLQLMTTNHLPGGADMASLAKSPIALTETNSEGAGFGLGFTVADRPALSLVPGNAGMYSWGGAAATAFWVDPADDLAVVFMTQLLYAPDRLRRSLQTFVYAAMTDSATLHPSQA